MTEGIRNNDASSALELALSLVNARGRDGPTVKRAERDKVYKSDNGLRVRHIVPAPGSSYPASLTVDYHASRVLDANPETGEITRYVPGAWVTNLAS